MLALDVSPQAWPVGMGGHREPVAAVQPVRVARDELDANRAVFR